MLITSQGGLLVDRRTPTGDPPRAGQLIKAKRLKEIRRSILKLIWYAAPRHLVTDPQSHTANPKTDTFSGALKRVIQQDAASTQVRHDGMLEVHREEEIVSCCANRHESAWPAQDIPKGLWVGIPQLRRHLRVQHVRVSSLHKTPFQKSWRPSHRL